MQIPINKALRKALQLGLNALRSLRPLVRFETGEYVSIERQLSRVGARSVGTFLPYAALDKHAVREAFARHTTYRVIDLHRLSAEDRGFLESSGLSVRNIVANSPFLSSEDHDARSAGRHTDLIDTGFQREALEARGVGATSPISGELLLSDRSLLAEPGHTIFYRFADRNEVFYLAVGREGMGYIKLYLYLPRLQAVILLGDPDWAWQGRWELDQFRAYLVANWKDVLAYLDCQGKAATCVLVDQGHFAHHIWNTLTGLQKVVEPQTLRHLDRLAVTAEPMGPIDRLFPEFEASRVERTSDADLIESALKRNLFLVRPGGTVVDDAVVERIYRVAVENSTPEFMRNAQEFRKSHRPILWTTIRAGNRTWVSQVEGIAAIASKLKEKYPKLALVVDGYVLPYGNQVLSAQQAELIREEQALAMRIRDLLDDSIDMHITVGKVVFDSVIYARLIDCYFAHHGSLQLKIGWISNKPGVVHSNRTILAGIPTTRRFGPAFTSRDKGVEPIYLAPELVTDVEGAISTKANLRWVDPMQNYDFDQRYAYAELVRILDAGNPADSPGT